MMTCNLKPPLANWLRLCLCCAALALLLPPSIAATLTTDKPDYPPYSNVYITGAGFQAGETVTVHLDRVYPDGARAPVWDAAPPPLADATGSFTVTWYIDSTDYIGATLDAIATGLSSGFAANATFTDAGYYIEAWSNVASTWQGNLNGSADHTYSEGDAIPVRMVVSGLTAGTPCTIELRYDAMVGAIHFVDYLTDYDAYLTPDPLSGLGLTPLPSPIDYLMPQDGTLPSGNLTTYNVSSIVWVGYSSGTGGSSGVRTLTFQVTPTATTIVLAYGVHLATEFYWGAGLGASRAPGSAAKLYAAADGGADDNLQINVGAIVEKANLVITKSDSPDPVCAGGALTYTLTVQNLGPNYTTTETIVDTLPANTTYASSVPTAGTATYNSTTHQVTWLPGPLQKTAVQLTITVTLNPAAAGTTLANTAAITASTPTDYVTANNTAVEYTSVYALPTITCPGDVTVSTAPGVCYATGAQLGDPVILALAGVASLVNDAPAQFPKGTTTVTWTVTDTCSFTATCKQTVTVNDTEKPTITCPANKSVTTDPGKCYATGVALDTPTTHDNCGVASVVAARFDDKPLTEPYPVGVTTVTWTVTDTAGLTATCPQTVTVTDAEPPTIACPRPETVECSKDVPEAATDYDSLVLQGGSASDSCGGPVTVTHMGDAISSQTCLNRYTITRTYRASDPGGNYAECTQVITVDDTAQPTITCPADVTVECDESTEPDNTGNATATDNCDPTPTVTYTDWTTPAAGIITVDSHCGPWDPSVNPTFPYGRADQNAPAAMPVTPGERVFIGNATGQVRAAGDFPLTGPDGYTSDPYGPVDNKQLTPGIYCPSARTPADWPTYLVALMGTFADSSGLLVGQPFEIGTKSLLVTVPEGASQLLFGLNDDKFADNSGSFSVQVGPVSCGTTIERTWTLTDACGNSASCVQTIMV